MFSTLLHPDYHTPRDEPARIDISEADEDDPVDVCDRVDRRDRAAASGRDSGVQARAVTNRGSGE